MRIHRVRLFHVPVDLAKPLRTSDGVHTSRNASIVEITDQDGCVGWGENVAPDGVVYVGESHEVSVRAMRESCVPALMHRDIDVRDVSPLTWWGFPGAHFAKHAIESALWDIEAKRNDVSLTELLGGKRISVTPGVVVGIADTIDEVLKECELRIHEGYRRIKLKIAPSWDYDVLNAVRQALGDDVILQVDANGAYGSDDIEHLCSLAEFDLQFIEQPFAATDVSSHIQLAQRGALRVCMDESIGSVSELEDMLTQGACSVVNIKPSRVGGIGEAVRMHDVAYQRGIDAWVGGMLETGIGRASCLALATLPGFTLSPDLSASDRYFRTDVTQPFVLDGGEIRVPAGLGIGVELLPEVKENPATRIETLFED